MTGRKKTYGQVDVVETGRNERLGSLRRLFHVVVLKRRFFRHVVGSEREIRLQLHDKTKSNGFSHLKEALT